MPGKKVPSTAKIFEWKQSGELDNGLKTGRITQEQYDRAMNRIEAEGGVASNPQTDAADPVSRMGTGAPEEVDAATLKKRAVIEYDRQYKSGALPHARASGYIPGVGDVPLRAGPEWDAVKDKVPGYLRDASLLPSRDAVWQEPLVQQAQADLQSADGLDADHVQYREYADKKWQEAYENARSHGKSIYRAKDIGDDAPDYLRTLKKVSNWLEPVETLGRAAARQMTLGASDDVLDSSGSSYETMHGSPETQGAAKRLLGVDAPPPSAAEADEMLANKQNARVNIQQGDTTLGRHPTPEIVGNVVGAAAPSGASRILSRGAELVTGAAQATGRISGALRNAGAAVLAGFPSELSILDDENATRESAGMAPKYESISREAAKRAGAQGLFAGALSIPQGASNALRASGNGNEIRGANLRALEEAGGGTSNKSLSGVVPPPGYEEMALSDTGAEAGFRHQAASHWGAELEADKGAIMDGLGPRVDALGEGIAADGDQLAQRLEVTAAGAYRDGAAKTKSFDESVADMTEKVRKRLGSDLDSTRARHQAMNEEALTAEGAAPVPPPPSAIADVEDFVTSPKQTGDALGLGQDDIPRVSSLPVIGKYHQVIARLAFADGATMPVASAKKFKDAASKLVNVRTVTADELPLYNNIAIDAKELEGEAGESLWQVAIPRKVDARELDDFINSADELAKMPVSTGPDAQRWTEIGAVARDMRKSAFPRLTQAKEFMHAERNANEELLRSLGLNKGLKDVEGVDATASVGNAMKSFAEGADFRTPNGMAIPRKNFEGWLALEHPDMLDDYMALRSQAYESRSLQDLGVHYDNTLPVQKKSIQALQDALTGKTQQAEAVMGVFSHVSPQMKATRTEAARVNDVFKTLGAPLGDSVTIAQRVELRNKLMEVAINGPESADWQVLAKQLRPEQVKELGSINRAVSEVDKMFSDAGLGKKYWKTAEAGQVSKDLFNLLGEYKKFGANPDFTRLLENASPATRQFMLKARGSAAYQALRNEVKSGASVADAVGGKPGYLRSFGEALNYHLDALYQTSTKGGRAGRAVGAVTGIASPVRAGVGFGTPVENENVGDTARQAGKTMYTVGSSAKSMFVDAVEFLGQKYGPKAR